MKMYRGLKIYLQELDGPSLRMYMRRGKSGLHRAKCWVIPRGGDPRQAQQRVDRLILR